MMIIPSFLSTLFIVSLINCEEEAKSVYFQTPNIPKNSYLALYLEPGDFGSKLIQSEAKKVGADENIAKYDGKWKLGVPDKSAVEGDYALILNSKARHHAIAFNLNKPLKFDTKTIVIQYEIMFQNGMECGGAYIKLLSKSDDMKLSNFHDKTPFTIMFGPDKCGTDSKLHFIFRHKNPVTGEFEEKFISEPKKDLDTIFNDKMTHLFTLVLHDDNKFEIYVDQVLTNSGSLLLDFTPSVNPQKEISDPADKKPDDWDDRRKISDPVAKKPDDWDESLTEFIRDPAAVKPADWLENEVATILDPEAKQPEDWDKEIDGEWEAPKIDNPKCKEVSGCGKWEAPLIKNPAYKGIWSAPLIDNPNYKGIWEPRKIPNPNYFEDQNPYKMTEVYAVGLELWSMSDGVAFDNFLIVDSKEVADKFSSETWVVKHAAEMKANPSAQSVVDFVRDIYNKKPWLIAIISIAVLIPIILLFYWLCRGSRDASTSEVARSKKDDDYSVNEDNQQYSAAGPATINKKPSSRSHSPAIPSDKEGDETGDGLDESEHEANNVRAQVRRRTNRKE